MNAKTNERYFFFGLLLVIGVFSFFIFKPFLIVIIVSTSLSVVLRPLYLWLLRKFSFGKKWLAAFLTVLFFIIIFCGPLYGIGTIVFHQSQDLYTTLSDNGGTEDALNDITTTITDSLPESQFIDVKERVESATAFITKNIANIFTGTINTIFSFFLILLSLFYFLRDGERWRKLLIDISPLADKDDKKIIVSLEGAVTGVIKGYLLVALLQGVAMGIGLWIFGVPNPALWGTLAGIASLVPMVGTAMVWVPATLYLLSTGANGQALGLFVWSIGLVSVLDNVLTPLFVGKGLRLPSLVILFAVLGGLALLGPAGILIGPLSVSLLHTLVNIYRTSFRA